MRISHREILKIVAKEKGIAPEKLAIVLEDNQFFIELDTDHDKERWCEVWDGRPR